MADIDLSKLSLPELRALVVQVQEQTFLAEQAAQNDAVGRKERIGESVKTLENLLGPKGATSGMDSIRAVLAFGDTTISQNPGQAVVLLLKGLEIVVQTQLDIAKTLAEA